MSWGAKKMILGASEEGRGMPYVCAQGTLLSAPVFFGRTVVHNPPVSLLQLCENFICVCTMFFFTSSSAKTSTDTGGGSGSPNLGTSTMSPDQMHALLAQQQAALASLQTKLGEPSVIDKSGVPDLTSAAVTELLAKPKLASWMRQCGDALGHYARAVERPLARPVGRAGGGGDHGDWLAYRMWSVLVQSQRAYTEKFADRAALSALQATNPLDGLASQDARKQGCDNFTYKVCHERRGVAVEDGQGPLGT